MNTIKSTIAAVYIGESPSVCLYKNNEIVYQQKEEILTQSKIDGYPLVSFLELIEKVDNIDYLVYIDSRSPLQQNSSDLTIELFFSIAQRLKKIKDDEVTRLIDMSLHQHKCKAAHAFYNVDIDSAFVINIDKKGGFWSIILDDNLTYIKETETLFQCTAPLQIKTLQKNMKNLADQETVHMQEFDASAWETNGNFDISVYSNPTISDLYEALANYCNWSDVDIQKIVALSMQGKENPQVFDFFVDSGYLQTIDKNVVLQTPRGPELNKQGNSFLLNNNYLAELTDLSNRTDTVFKAVAQSDTAIINYVNHLIDTFSIDNLILSGDILQENMPLIEKIKHNKNVSYFLHNYDHSLSSLIGAILLWLDKQKQLERDLSISLTENIEKSRIEYILQEKNLSFKETSPREASEILNTNCLAVYSQKESVSKILFNPAKRNNSRFLNTVKLRDTFKPFTAIANECDTLLRVSCGNRMFLYNAENSDKINFCLLSKNNQIKVELTETDSVLAEIIGSFSRDTKQQFIGQTPLRQSAVPNPSTIHDVITNCNKLYLKYLYLLDYGLLVTIE